MRVCPFCGRPPGAGVFCEACGRNLAAVERLPSAEEWEAGGGAAGAEEAGGSGADVAVDPAAAVAAFLAAMHDAGDPGATDFPAGKPSMFGRTKKVRGWVVRAVDREDFEGPKRYEPGLVLTVDGAFHQLDSELRGWGQRDFPAYNHTASAEPIDAPLERRLVAELDAVRAATGA
ncbi:MAG TPA: hypothetical protein VEX67_03795 [Solirubrobacteraceae bacterium]|nr:hypothetical protein [Solirubrobacteraceae bacterium]